MGLLEKLNSGPTKNNQSLLGQRPETLSSAFPSSQMHAQGNFGQEAAGFGKVNNEFVAKTPSEATNVKYKTLGEYSTLDLDGKTPDIRSGALPTSQMHAQGNFGQEAEGFGKVNKGFVAKTPAEAINVNYKSSKEYSTLDLNGKIPANNYRDTAPEGKQF